MVGQMNHWHALAEGMKAAKMLRTDTGNLSGLSNSKMSRQLVWDDGWQEMDKLNEISSADAHACSQYLDKDQIGWRTFPSI